MNLYHRLEQFDKTLFALFVAVFGIGVVFLFSSFSHLTGVSDEYQMSLGLRHLINAVPALAGFAFFWLLDLKRLKQFSIYFYLLTVFFLVLTLMTHDLAGTQRWLHIFFFTFQPSELAKLGVIFMLAFLLSQKKQHLKSLLEVMPIMLWVGLPFFLVFRQPDLGTSIMFILIFISMAFWGNISPKIFLELISPLMSIVLVHFLPWGAWVSWSLYLMALGFYLYFTRTHWVEFVFVLLLNVAAAVVSPLLWMSLKDYQQARILSFINPGLDPLGQGIRYHAQQAATAIGSGGLWGKGLFDGTLSRLGFIPEQHTDFIFSLICEESGLIGAVVVFVLFALILYRGLSIAANSKDSFSSLVALGVVAMIGMHALINMGMCVGIFPVVGVPLPLISYGGNSLFIHFCALGILENIHSDHQRYYL